MKKILLINPWIYDFAAYDLWIKPWGLLKISAILKKNGFDVFFVDVLDRHHLLLNEEISDLPDGTGKFNSVPIEKPDIIKNIPRQYRRYGLPEDVFKKALPESDIDLILVSSGMTYWYPGVFNAIRILKEFYRDVPVVLGGAYATLSSTHAEKYSGADHIVGNKELNKLSSLLNKDCDFSYVNILNEEIDHSWYIDPSYAVLRLSLGCPFDCAYCAQKELGPGFILKDKVRALEEVRSLYDRGIRNFAFYDDALLFNGEYINSYFEGVLRENISASFHTPNGLHAKFLTAGIADLMKRVNFVNPVLSLEISNDEKGQQWHKKVTRNDLETAVSNLKRAGYKNGEYMVYLLMGVPGSSLEDIVESVDFVHSLGAKISISEFSPTPYTRMAYDNEEGGEDPLLQNNSIYPTFSLSEWGKIREIKNKAVTLNALLPNVSKQLKS